MSRQRPSDFTPPQFTYPLERPPDLPPSRGQLLYDGQTWTGGDRPPPPLLFGRSGVACSYCTATPPAERCVDCPLGQATISARIARIQDRDQQLAGQRRAPWWQKLATWWFRQGENDDHND